MCWIKTFDREGAGHHRPASPAVPGDQAGADALGAAGDDGDLLVRLDATQAQASLQMVSKQLDEFRAKIARLSAERDDLTAAARSLV